MKLHGRGLAAAAAAIALIWAAQPMAVAQPSAQDVADHSYLSFKYEILAERGGPSGTIRYVGSSSASAVPPDAVFRIRITDTSVDNQDPAGQGGASNTPLHILELNSSWPVGGDGRPIQPGGWTLAAPEPNLIYMRSGDTADVTFVLKHLVSTTDRSAVGHVTIAMKGQFPESSAVSVVPPQTVAFMAIIVPEAAYTILGGAPEEQVVSPGRIVSIPFTVTNAAFYNQRIRLEATFDMGGALDPFLIGASGMGIYTFEPLQRRDIPITFVTPREKLWYNYDTILMSARIQAIDENGQPLGVAQESGAVITLRGMSVEPPAVALVASTASVSILGVLFVLASRRHYQERVLGKPVAPWRLRQEKQELDQLRRDDPKKFYVLRYFVMEQEFQSALDWYGAYKRRTKRQLKHERTSGKYQDKAQAAAGFTGEKFERKASRRRRYYNYRTRRWERYAEKKQEKYEGKAQASSGGGFEKRHKAWEQQVERLTRMANKPKLKDLHEWEKERDRRIGQWEERVAQTKEKHEKQLAQMRSDFQKQVKKEDKDAWRSWKEAHDDALAENKVRAAEGKAGVAIPELKSTRVPTPEWPAGPDLPAKPKLPPRPELDVPDNLPKEPTHDAPSIEGTKFGGKLDKKRRKAGRKKSKFDRKKAKRLARVERRRARRAVHASRKVKGYEKAAKSALEPGLVERALKLTPEDRERRAHVRALKARHKDELEHFRETEQVKLESVKADAARQQAQAEAALIRAKATLRAGAASQASAPASAGKAVEAAQKALDKVSATTRAAVEKAQQAFDDALAKESQRVWHRFEQEQDARLEAEEAAKAQPKSSKSTTGSDDTRTEK